MIKDIIIVILLGILLSIVLLNTPRQEGRWYDCGMAEWHPDIPPQVKEECRRRALEHWQSNQNKTVI